MKLELEFATGDDLINFLADLGPIGRKMIGTTAKVSTAAAREVNTPSAAVTPEKQEAARQSTGKGKAKDESKAIEAAAQQLQSPATPEEALAQAVSAPAPAPAPTSAPTEGKPLVYESDVAPLIAQAQARDKDAVVAWLTKCESINPETKKLSGKALKPEHFANTIIAMKKIIDAESMA